MENATFMKTVMREGVLFKFKSAFGTLLWVWKITKITWCDWNRYVSLFVLKSLFLVFRSLTWNFYSKKVFAFTFTLAKKNSWKLELSPIKLQDRVLAQQHFKKTQNDSYRRKLVLIQITKVWKNFPHNKGEVEIIF